MNPTIRWFTFNTITGEVVLVFRTGWEDGRLTSEQVWNKSTKAWQDSREVVSWWLMGELGIEEIGHIEAKALLEQQGHH